MPRLPPPKFGDLHPKKNEPGPDELRRAAEHLDAAAIAMMQAYTQYGPTPRVRLLDIAGACRRAHEAQQKYYAAKGAAK